MKILVLGGASCGKSAFAEKLSENLFVENSSKNLVYLATLDPRSGGDTKERIARHQKQRNGAGFLTVEMFVCDGELCFFKDAKKTDFEKSFPPDSTVLLEDVGNLAANVLFSKNGKNAFEKIDSFLEKLFEKCKNVVFVSNEIFLEKLSDDKEITAYFRLLSRINQKLSSVCERVFFVVAGIPVLLKS